MSECGLCHQPYMVLNPHPEAGKPDRYLEVGACYVCPPCTQSALHHASTDRDVLRQAVEVALDFLNGRGHGRYSLGVDDHDGGCPVNGPEDCLYCYLKASLGVKDDD